jgi:hypothetical protein
MSSDHLRIAYIAKALIGQFLALLEFAWPQSDMEPSIRKADRYNFYTRRICAFKVNTKSLDQRQIWPFC